MITKIKNIFAMKVICIDGDWMRDDGTEPVNKMPQEGEVYTVVDRFTDELGTFYVLAELDPEDSFLSELFAPLSEIDETTFERNYNTQTV